MKRFVRPLAVLVATTALLSAGCFFRAGWIDRHTQWLPLVLPVQLVEGFRAEADFTVDRPADDYEVELRCLETMPLSERLLAEEVSVEGELRTAGQTAVIEHLSAQHGFRGERGKWLSVTLGEFAGRPGIGYHIAVQFNRSSAVLSVTQPALVVRLDAGTAKDLEGDIFLLDSAGWLAGLVALGLLAVLLAPKTQARAGERGPSPA